MYIALGRVAARCGWGACDVHIYHKWCVQFTDEKARANQPFSGARCSVSFYTTNVYGHATLDASEHAKELVVFGPDLGHFEQPIKEYQQTELYWEAIHATHETQYVAR